MHVIQSGNKKCYLRLIFMCSIVVVQSSGVNKGFHIIYPVSILSFQSGWNIMLNSFCDGELGTVLFNFLYWYFFSIGIFNFITVFPRSKQCVTCTNILLKAILFLGQFRRRSFSWTSAFQWEFVPSNFPKSL